MSFLVRCDKDMTVQFKDRITPSPSWMNEAQNNIFIGETWGQSNEEICNSDWEKDPSILNKYNGSFSLVSMKGDRLFFASNLGGIEALYFYRNDTLFLLSDNMWDIIKVIKPQFEKLNIENIRKMMVVGYTTIDGETFIKGLKVLRPGHIVSFNMKTGELIDKKYLDFKIEPKITDLSEAVELFDRELNKAMKTIKHICGECTYGVGISGGLDSRIIPYYAIENGLNIIGFNNCVPRPKTFLLARSCKNARKIAKIYGIKYLEIRWSPSKLDEKKRMKLKNYPIGPLDSGFDLCKYEIDGIPQFDVLLTGGSGEIVGATLHKDIKNMSNDELVNYIAKLFFRNFGTGVTENRIIRGLEYVFGLKIKKFRNIKNNVLNLIAEEKTKEVVLNDIKKYILNMKENGANNLDIVYNYVVNVLSYQNRHGAYESRFGTKRSFSIYVPFLLPICLKLSPSLLEERLILEELIRVKLPQMASIKSESFKGSPNENKQLQFTWIRRLLNIVIFMMRGNGSYVNQYYYKKSEIQSSFLNDMQNGTKWFYKIFPIEEHIKTFAKQDVKTFFSVWDMKQILDCIEKETYMEFD